MPRSNSNFEEELMASIEDEDIDDGVVDETTTPEVEQDTGTQDATPETETTTATAESTGEQQTAESAPQVRPGGFGYDSKGNVIDDKGQILAKSGVERRLFEKSQMLAYQTRQRDAEIDRLRKENTTLRESTANIPVLNSVPAQLGLNPQEAAMGMQLIANFKRDPIATLKYVLTEAQAMGHNIGELTGDKSLDTRAIAQLIDQRLAPITQQRQQQEREVAIRQQAQQQYEAFVSNPEFQFARVHEDVLARLVSQDPQLTPETAYYKLQAWALQNQLDFSRPLESQVRQKMSVQDGQQQQPPVQQQRPIVRGGGAAPVTTESTYADPSASYADIVRQAMRDAGMDT
ncbi:hypothetical protein HC928_00590 [bacterium]|nr:hypothetical protein [bacterium]